MRYKNWLFSLLSLCFILTTQSVYAIDDVDTTDVVYALKVNTIPQGADIKLLNVEPKFQQGMLVKPGTYELSVSKKGYPTRKLSVQIVDKNITVNVVLGSVSPTDIPEVVDQYPLIVNTIPKDATVKIMNIMPKFYQGILLAPGKYDVRVSKAGYATRDTVVDIADAAVTIDVELPQSLAVADKGDEIPEDKTDTTTEDEVDTKAEGTDAKDEADTADETEVDTETEGTDEKTKEATSSDKVESVTKTDTKEATDEAEIDTETEDETDTATEDEVDTETDEKTTEATSSDKVKSVTKTDTKEATDEAEIDTETEDETDTATEDELDAETEGTDTEDETDTTTEDELDAETEGTDTEDETDIKTEDEVDTETDEKTTEATSSDKVKSITKTDTKEATDKKSTDKTTAAVSSTVSDIAPQQYALYVDVIPENALIKITNIVPKFKQGMLLGTGKYNVVISKTGYQSVSQTAEIVNKDVTLAVELKKENVASKYALSINVTPKDATIKITNVESKFTQGILLVPGKYNLQVSKEHYKTYAKTIEIIDQAVTLNIELISETSNHATEKITTSKPVTADTSKKTMASQLLEKQDIVQDDSRSSRNSNTSAKTDNSNGENANTEDEDDDAESDDDEDENSDAAEDDDAESDDDADEDSDATEDDDAESDDDADEDSDAAEDDDAESDDDADEDSDAAEDDDAESDDDADEDSDAAEDDDAESDDDADENSDVAEEDDDAESDDDADENSDVTEEDDGTTEDDNEEDSDTDEDVNNDEKSELKNNVDNPKIATKPVDDTTQKGVKVPETQAAVQSAKTVTDTMADSKKPIVTKATGEKTVTADKNEIPAKDDKQVVASIEKPSVEKELESPISKPEIFCFASEEIKRDQSDVLNVMHNSIVKIDNRFVEAVYDVYIKPGDLSYHYNFKGVKKGELFDLLGILYYDGREQDVKSGMRIENKQLIIDIENGNDGSLMSNQVLKQASCSDVIS